jgi:L-lactate dehydrogenase complex protein LldG
MVVAQVSAREEVLARVRSAVAEARVPEVTRAYRRALERDDDLVDLLEERLLDYRADVRRAADVRAAVEAVCDERAATRIGIASGLPDEWRPRNVELVVDSGLSTQQLDALDGVVTGCTAAIAETGTLILSGAPADGRRALTLVPDLHVCVLRAGQVVGSVPEGIAAAAERIRESRSPITFVSGPSATSDIELKRVEGVHGPRQLVVVVTP